MRVIARWARECAPFVVASAILAAVIGAKTNAWHIPFYVFAGALLVLTPIVAWPGLAKAFGPMERTGFTRNRDQIWYAAGAKGMPPGYRTLMIGSVVGAVLSEFRAPYVLPAIGGYFLTAAWGLNRRRYPSDE